MSKARVPNPDAQRRVKGVSLLDPNHITIPHNLTGYEPHYDMLEARNAKGVGRYRCIQCGHQFTCSGRRRLIQHLLGPAYKISTRNNVRFCPNPIEEIRSQLIDKIELAQQTLTILESQIYHSASSDEIQRPGSEEEEDEGKEGDEEKYSDYSKADRKTQTLVDFSISSTSSSSSSSSTHYSVASITPTSNLYPQNNLNDENHRQVLQQQQFDVGKLFHFVLENNIPPEFLNNPQFIAFYQWMVLNNRL